MARTGNRFRILVRDPAPEAAPMSDRDLLLPTLDKPDPAAHPVAAIDQQADPAFDPPTVSIVLLPETTGLYQSADSRTDHPAAERAGVMIAGRYKLVQPIGEGGMGTVWLADQTEPVKRQVAVKLIRVERGRSATILARFEAERQAITVMDHPHIARLSTPGPPRPVPRSSPWDWSGASRSPTSATWSG
jgi:eukaryotic-like serine/threonine-protein kinase